MAFDTKSLRVRRVHEGVGANKHDSAMMVFSPTEARKIMLGHLKREVLMVLNPTELTPEGLQPLLQALKGPVVVTRRQLQVMPAWVAVMVLTPQC